MEPASPKRPMTSSLPPFLRFYCSSALYSRQSALTENFGHHQPLLSTTIQSVVAASVFPQNRRFRLGLLSVHRCLPMMVLNRSVSRNALSRPSLQFVTGNGVAWSAFVPSMQGLHHRRLAYLCSSGLRAFRHPLGLGGEEFYHQYL